jgi:hypothetical protein
MSKVQELYEQVMALSPKEREEFTSRFWDSVVPEPPGEDISREEWERVWGEEIAARSERYHRGEISARDAFEALDESRKRLRERRGQ